MRLDRTYGDAAIHDAWHAVYRQDPAQAAFDDRVYDWLFERLKPTSRWIDAGCGTGHHALRLAARGSHVTAVDLSPNALATAENAAAATPFASRIRFLCRPLDDLEGVDPANVHCRGVLMHIPQWRESIASLCRSVEPGGYLVLFESNTRAIETAIVRMMRRIVSVKSKVIANESGLEFWSEINGNPFLARVFNLGAIDDEVRAHGLNPVLRRPLFLWDVNRIPAPLRKIARGMNRLWFTTRAPFAAGVILVYRKNGLQKKLD